MNLGKSAYLIETCRVTFESFLFKENLGVTHPLVWIGSACSDRAVLMCICTQTFKVATF